MEFLLLGPLVVRDDGGRELELRRRQQRALLTVLVLHANDVVPRERLVDAVWSERPPPTAKTALHGHVSQLRKLLGPRLVTQPPGYSLRAEPDEVDVERFEALLAESRRTKNPEQRAQALREALALWRGAPLAEFESEAFARPEIDRLSELRRVVVEERIDADLELGRAAEVVPELETLVAADPFRERLRAQLMRALYRAGRQTEALDVYRVGRELLVTGLGIDPGPELQHLERQILSHDPVLGEPTPALARLPSGTVTFVFTDIAGSTALLHELGAERYAEGLARHRQLLRAAFSAHGGVEVDTQGDSFFFAFTRAADALAAADAAQRSLAGESTRAKIGIHTGEPIVTAEGYVGIEVHRAARIGGLAHGGQTLVSQTTRALAPAADVRDLGKHRLKDFAEPTPIWQLGPDEFPPLRSLHRTNLPVPHGALLGRERELAEIHRLIAQGVRLVTLTGPGGSGKTRLAVEAAEELTEVFPGGVFFVPLGPLRDGALVRSAVAHALELAENELDQALRNAGTLIVLDNAEHLTGVDSVVKQLLDGSVVVLVTSRAPLHLRIEHELAVGPLDDDAAARFFVTRAAAVGCSLEPNEEVRAVCARVDNLPLAIELAAARSKILTPAELLRRLERRFDVLTGGPRDAPDRQRTLRRTLDWSYDLLDADEQGLFARLAVFTGDWTLDAAEAVCGASFDLLSALLNRSLIDRSETAGDGRFAMLETIREYALERLDETTHAVDVRRSHASFFLALAEQGEAELDGPGLRDALRTFDAELDNLRAALQWAQVDEPDSALRIAAAMGRYWTIRGLFSEARTSFDGVLGVANVESPAGLKALHEAGHFARMAGDLEHARELYERGLRLAETIGPPSYVGMFLMLLGQVELLTGRWDSCRDHLQRALVLQRDAGDAWGAALTLSSLGAVALETNDVESAAAHLVEGADGLRTAGDEVSLASVLPALAYAQCRKGLGEEAARFWREGLRIAVDLGAWPTAAWALLVGAFVEADRIPIEAARWMAATEAAYERAGWVWEPIELRVRDEACDALRARLDDVQWRAARERGLPESLELVVVRVLAGDAALGNLESALTNEVRS